MLEAGSYVVSAESSEIGWLGGKKLVPGDHSGVIGVSEGMLTLGEDGLITDGFVVIDMSSIELDEGDTGGQDVLDHLASDDFFSIETYPTARLDINASEQGEMAGIVVDGSMTIKESTQPVSMIVVPTQNEDGTIAFVGEFVFDRSLFDIRFGSGTFFDDLGDAIIKDEITIDFNLVVTPKA
jgi:polyisoprenoid-binding protein YceI